MDRKRSRETAWELLVAGVRLSTKENIIIIIIIGVFSYAVHACSKDHYMHEMVARGKVTSY